MATIDSSVSLPTSTVTNTVISQIDSRVTLKNQQRRVARTVVAAGLRKRRSRGTRSWNYFEGLSTNTPAGATVISGKAITGSTITNTTRTRASGGF